jgi:hypothetical protein
MMKGLSLFFGGERAVDGDGARERRAFDPDDGDLRRCGVRRA